MRNIGSTSERELEHIFGTFGQIKSCKILKQPTGDMALVTFFDPAGAQAASNANDLRTSENQLLSITLSGDRPSGSSRNKSDNDSGNLCILVIIIVELF